jgi:hypothetical protein
MLSAAKCRSLLEDLAVIGTKHLLFLVENKQKADPSLRLRIPGQGGHDSGINPVSIPK